MKANELRIGNLLCVSLKSGKGRESHIKIGVQDIVKIKEGIGSFNYKPIPLTEEWLVKFGFEKHFINDSELYFYRIKTLSHGHISFYFNSKGFNCDLGTTSGYHFGTTQIQHVHQLQNLYFALTGEELTLSDKP